MPGVARICNDRMVPWMPGIWAIERSRRRGHEHRGVQRSPIPAMPWRQCKTTTAMQRELRPPVHPRHIDGRRAAHLAPRRGRIACVVVAMIETRIVLRHPESHGSLPRQPLRVVKSNSVYRTPLSMVPRPRDPRHEDVRAVPCAYSTRTASRRFGSPPCGISGAPGHKFTRTPSRKGRGRASCAHVRGRHDHCLGGIDLWRTT